MFLVKPSKARRFLGPWELFEVLDREFRAVDPTFPHRDSRVSPWRVEAADVLNPREVARRIRELRLDTAPGEEEKASSSKNGGAAGFTVPLAGGVVIDVDGSARSAAVLEAALAWAPGELVKRCRRHLVDDCGRTLSRAVPDLDELDASERDDVRRRFNRQVLEAAFGGMLRAAAGREMQELLERDRAHTARAAAAGQDAKPGGHTSHQEDAHARRRGDVKHESTLPPGRWALCFSGGGIRSGTFSLGVAQALARAGLLSRFDYLSTVSGGGYVGSWLSAWMHRQGRDSVLQELKREADGPLQPEPAPVHHLRTYSNYLAPKKGLFSADAWTLGATILRNLLLNWLVVLPILAAVLMVPLFCAAVVAHPPALTVLPVWLAALTIGGYAAASTGVWFVHSRRPGGFRRARPATAGGDGSAEGEAQKARANADAVSPEPGRHRDQRAFLTFCLAPIVASIALLTTAAEWMLPDGTHAVAGIWGLPRMIADLPLPWQMAVFGALTHLTGWVPARLGAARRGRGMETKTPWPLELVVIVLTGALAGGIIALTLPAITSLTVAVEPLIAGLARTRLFHVADRHLLSTILAFPSFVTALVLAGFAFVGAASRWQDDEEREWSSRYSAWLLIAAFGWLGLSSVVIASAYVLKLGILAITGGGGVATGAAAAKLGQSHHSGPNKAVEAAKKGLGNLARRYALALAAPAAVLLILLCLAAVDQIAAAGAIDLATAAFGGHWWLPGIVVALLAGALFLVGSVAGRLVESNRFSLHAMYRSRLIRAYLGASRPAGTRRPNPFTGFDPADNVQLWELGYPPAEGHAPLLRPLHVVNMALNVTAGSNLAWQERKARSFTATPLDAGACGLGYRRIRRGDLGPEAYYGGGEGMSLGTAMAVSGAAASPNMGYHSSPPVTFLMALFNARLGWWLGNPGWAGHDTFHHPSPRGTIAPIFLDLLGLATDSASVVYLSDGGHFENLGLYEMVLRRCAVIVVADGSCDDRFDYADLGNAVRKIRVDMGIPVDFPGGFPIHAPGEDGGAHVVRGVVRYSAVDANATDGVLVYVKPTLTGDEPRDVVAYARVQKDFPHQSTADQFFDESQFESYRALGQHSGNAAVAELVARGVAAEQPA